MFIEGEAAFLPKYNFLTVQFVPCISEYKEEECADADTAFAFLNILDKIFVELTFNQL